MGLLSSIRGGEDRAFCFPDGLEGLAEGRDVQVWN